MKMLDEIKTPDRAEKWMMDALAKKAKIMGFGHRVYKSGDSRVPIMREIGRDLGKRVGQGAMGADLRKTRGHDGAREESLCERRSLRCAGLYDARISAGIEYADLCRFARCRLVRACRRATRSQPPDSSALALHRAGCAALQNGVSHRTAPSDGGDWSMGADCSFPFARAS